MQVCLLEEKYNCLRISIGEDNMKSFNLLFDGFAEFEVNIASLFLISKQFEIITATVDGKTVTGEGGFCVNHMSLLSKLK